MLKKTHPPRRVGTCPQRRPTAYLSRLRDRNDTELREIRSRHEDDVARAKQAGVDLKVPARRICKEEPNFGEKQMTLVKSTFCKFRKIHEVLAGVCNIL